MYEYIRPKMSAFIAFLVANAQASLCKCTGSPEPLRLAYTKYRCRMPAWPLKKGFCTNLAMS